MLIERKWKKWVYFYAPMAVFIVFTLFPFYWMAITAFRPDEELYATWRQPNAAPLWTLAPTLEHMKGLLQTTAFPTWLWNTMLIATVSTIISLICGTFAGYALARLRFQGSFLGTAIFITYLVPQTLLFIPLADIIRDMQLGNTPWALMLTYPTILIPFCTWLLMGYFKTIPKELEECAHRRCDAFRRHGAHHSAGGRSRHPLGRNFRLYAIVERVHLRAGVHGLGRPKDRAGGRGFELIRGDIFFWGQLMAGALLGSVPVALVYSFFVEYYVTGLTGSVKG